MAKSVPLLALIVFPSSSSNPAIYASMASRFASSLGHPLTIISLALLVLFLGDHFFMLHEPSPGATTPSSGVQALQSQPPTPRSPSTKQHRILCYGDSLTAGTTTDSYTLHPYAPFLEQGLKESGRNVLVRHVGLPGWTAQHMVDTIADDKGLEYQIRRVKDPSLSLVIILSGTNDLGHLRSQEEITKSVLKLHATAFDNQVPATLAIAIPPSGYTSQNSQARAVAEGVNDALLANSDNEPRMHFIPFPFEFERNGENWSSDTLHFSPKGYQRLGESVVSVVGQILDELS